MSRLSIVLAANSLKHLYSVAHVKERWKLETGRTYIPVKLAKTGSIIIPGMTDSHGHIMEYGKKLLLDLDGVPTRQGK